MTGTDVALIRLYYESYGMTAEEIASALHLYPAEIRVVINDTKMAAPLEKKIEADKKAALVNSDLDKQVALMPHYARTEAVILGKLTDVALGIDQNDPNAAQMVASCSKALKDLRSAGVQAKLEDTAGANGITVQILNSL